MSYSDYLQSSHWRKFRAKVLSLRKWCQYCGTIKKLNVHHKHYKTVGRETDSDVIILCQICHIKNHQKPKWELAKKKRELMDFTRTKYADGSLYEASSILRQCVRCSELHPIFYMAYSFGLRLVMACPNSKPRVKQMPFEKDLAVPIYLQAVRYKI